jgi:hypothetical protein
MPLSSTRARSGRSRTNRLASDKLALIALVPALAFALGGPPATARASETAKLEVGFSPDRLGASTTINIRLEIGTTNGAVPSPVISFDTQLPPQLELIASTLGLAVCQPTALLKAGLEGCSPNARLGSGSAIVEVPFGPEIVRESANIEALMGPPIQEQVGLLIFAESLTPVFSQLVFPGTIVANEGSSEKLNTNIPPTPTLPGAADASATEVHLSIGPDHLTYYKKVHGRTVSFRPQGAQLPTICRREGFRFVAGLRFEDGTTLKTVSTVPCPPPLHRGRRA